MNRALFSFSLCIGLAGWTLQAGERFTPAPATVSSIPIFPPHEDDLIRSMGMQRACPPACPPCQTTPPNFGLSTNDFTPQDPSAAPIPTPPQPPTMADFPDLNALGNPNYVAVGPMIGDLFGGGGFHTLPMYDEGGDLIFVLFHHSPHEGDPITLAVPSGGLGSAPGANVGRLKLSENTSPLPRDRVFVNYSYFDNTPLFPGGVNVNRVTPGIEKTFLNGNMSIEFRAPFANTIGSTIGTNGPGGTEFFSSNQTEWGNLTTYVKALLWDNETVAFSTGLGVAAPTAQDYELEDVDTGSTMLRVRNQSVRLLPFFGAVVAPNERLFIQSLVQLDTDVSGNPVEVQDLQRLARGNAGPLYDIGRAQDATWLFADVSVGYWLYRNFGSSQWITGVSPLVELHYNTTLTEAEGASGRVGTMGSVSIPGGPSIDLLNGTAGVNFLLRDRASLIVAYATPLTGGSDRQFDGELRVLFNWYFGGLNRLSRAQF